MTSPPATFPALTALLETRSSCRAYRPEPLEPARIARLLGAAQRTPSWSNTQPWRLTVIGGATLEAIRAEMFARAATNPPPAPEVEWPREIRGPERARRRACGWGLYATLGIEKGDRAASARQARENFRFFGAPHLVLVSCDEALGPHGVMDCGGWVTAFLLTCAADGVGAIAQAAVAAWPDIWRRHLPLDAAQRIVCGVAFGGPDQGAPVNRFRTDRADLAEVVRWVS